VIHFISGICVCLDFARRIKIVAGPFVSDFGLTQTSALEIQSSASTEWNNPIYVLIVSAFVYT